jgi:hypothetical protein
MLVKLVITKLVAKFFVFYGARKFVAAVTNG